MGDESHFSTIEMTPSQGGIKTSRLSYYNLTWPSTGIFWGSPAVRDHLRSQTSEFTDKYRTDGMRKIHCGEPTTLQEGIQAANSYIDACQSPQAREWDFDSWNAIGGKTHIATIKPDKGFEWFPGYEPASKT
jgi:hypothetical protein